MKTENIKQELSAKGFVVLKNFFNEDEISLMEKEIFSKSEKFEKINLGDVLPDAYNHLDKCVDILESAKVKSALNFIEDLHMTKIIQAHNNMFSNWHTDAGEAYGLYAKDLHSENYKIYKMLFFTSKTSKSNCFAVIEGSHKQASDNRKETLVETDIGDLIIFDVRLKHRGEIASPLFKFTYYLSKILNYRPQVSKDGKFIVALTNFLRKIFKKGNRVSLQFVFGENNSITKEYEESAKLQEQKNVY